MSSKEQSLTSIPQNEYMPDVTVITPIHNSAPWLDETIMSVRNQTYQDLKYLLLDDRSDDDSLAIAEQHAEEDHRLEVTAVHFGSVSHTRQHGIDRATTPFVAFLDGDDRWHPDFLKRRAYQNYVAWAVQP